MHLILRPKGYGEWGENVYICVCECQCAWVLLEKNAGSHVVSERGLGHWSMLIDQDSSQLTETHCEDNNVFFPYDGWELQTISADYINVNWWFCFIRHSYALITSPFVMGRLQRPCLFMVHAWWPVMIPSQGVFQSHTQYSMDRLWIPLDPDCPLPKCRSSSEAFPLLNLCFGSLSCWKVNFYIIPCCLTKTCRSIFVPK